MRKIVSFSGGFDSTLALIQTLITSSEYDEIICLSVYHKLTGISKLDKERKARKKIIDYLTEKYSKMNLQTYELEVDLKWESNNYGNNRGLSQPIFWICNIAPFISDEDTVILGYIKDDQAPAKIESMKRMWNAAMEIQNDKLTKIEFPLLMHSKSEVIKDLLRSDPEVVEMCFSCESLDRDSSACGRCEPCNHLKSALVSLIVYEPQSIADKARELLKSKFDLEIEVKYPIYDKEVATESTETNLIEDSTSDDSDYKG